MLTGPSGAHARDYFGVGPGSYMSGLLRLDDFDVIQTPRIYVANKTLV